MDQEEISVLSACEARHNIARLLDGQVELVASELQENQMIISTI